MAKAKRPAKAKDLQGIRQVCRPEPLANGELDAFFVETDEGRDPHQHTRERLLGALTAGSDRRILFYGHRGCGKTTEINKFLAEQAARFVPVTFSAQREMSPTAVRAEDLILVVAERVLFTAQELDLAVDDKLLQPVLDYFSQTTVKSGQGRHSQAKAEAGVSTRSSLLGQLLGLFAGFSAEVKLDAHREDTTVAVLRKRPADLLAQANLLIEAVRSALPSKKDLLVVVEDLDKLDLKQARSLYVENVNILAGLRANVLYTIPVFLFHSPDVNAFRYHFDDVVALPMIKVADPRGARTPGFEVVRRIVLERVENGLIEEPALDLLVTQTGGVLRHAFEVLHTAALMSSARVPLAEEHVRYGLAQLRKDFWRQITLPYDPPPAGPKSVDELYDRLALYSRKQLAGERVLPVSDPVNQLLLKSCALVEYNGEGWFGVHPAVVENLRELGRLG